ncbi:MAG: hypothetical protein BroJett030_08720 [Alphaproteobacteria bacterium]|nr:MAG: hypothetical protein BroJett030_08720 [Alphaproteobacteria bacterium]
MPDSDVDVVMLCVAFRLSCPAQCEEYGAGSAHGGAFGGAKAATTVLRTSKLRADVDLGRGSMLRLPDVRDRLLAGQRKKGQTEGQHIASDLTVARRTGEAVDHVTPQSRHNVIGRY